MLLNPIEDSANLIQQTDKRPYHTRILMVDSQLKTLFLLAQIIWQFDTPIELLSAMSGADALQLTCKTPVDLLIVDSMLIDMPGVELMRQLIDQKQPPTSTILLAPDELYGQTVTAITPFSVDSYLVKPLSPEKTFAIIRWILGNQSPKHDYTGCGWSLTAPPPEKCSLPV